jgi:hypothetical protein
MGCRLTDLGDLADWVVSAPGLRDVNTGAHALRTRLQWPWTTGNAGNNHNQAPRERRSSGEMLR